jgi:hypothetical protein
MRSGALLIAQREKCVTYSASVIPPLPTSSTKKKYFLVKLYYKKIEDYIYYQDHSNHRALLYLHIRYSKYQEKYIEIHKIYYNLIQHQYY